MERNLIEGALLPLFRLRQPENLTLVIQRSALAAHKFLAANFNELFHELHSRGVKPSYSRILAESADACFNLLCVKWQQSCPCGPALQCSTSVTARSSSMALTISIWLFPALRDDKAACDAY